VSVEDKSKKKQKKSSTMRIYQHALLSLMVVTSLVGSTDAFIVPSARSTQIITQVASQKHVYEINRAMDEIAEQCGDIRKPVVALASQVEDMYNGAEGKDSISFNVLLKAWGKACQALEKQKYKPASRQTAPATIADIPSVAVYTPRDAAEHLTKHLMTAEASYEENPDKAEVVPDETSYNIAIGKFLPGVFVSDDHGLCQVHHQLDC